MATRFGAKQIDTTYSKQIRWLVTSLCGVILVVSSAILSILLHSSSNSQSAVGTNSSIAHASVLPVENKVGVLVARGRIEIGSQLIDPLFRSQLFNEFDVPPGAVLANDIKQLQGKFAKRLIHAGLPLVLEDVTSERPISSLYIPEGFRAASITVNQRQAVAGFATPNSRVDVLWSYRDKRGKPQVATLVRFAKILSVGTTTQSGKRVAVSGATRVTLLVTEKDAMRVELAGSLGKLSLTLIGNEGTERVTDNHGPISLEELLGLGAGGEVEKVYNGRMYTTDELGRQRCYRLNENQWKVDYEC